MPNRILREGINTSPRIAKLSWPAEVFYRRLMSVVDDYGRYHAHHMLLRAACYPMQLDKVSEADIGKWLGECRKAALVSVYEISGSPYLELLDFRQQVRAKKSKFPDPPPDAQQVPCECIADATQVQANAHLDVSEVEGVVGPRKRGARKVPLPSDFAISDGVRAWAEKHGFSNLDKHFESFVSKAKAKAYTYADWDSAFMNAIRDNWARLPVGDEQRFPI